MDLLHRKIKDINEDVYFLISSIENPYYFIQCHGIINNVIVHQDIIIYNIKVLDVLESSDMLLKLLMNNQRYRVYQNTKKYGRTINKKIITNKLTTQNIKQSFLNIFKKYYFEVPCMFTFDSYDEMKSNLTTLNTELISLLNERIEFITRRQFI